MRAKLLVCALLWLGSPVTAQTVFFSEGFENGLVNWSATGFWHAETATDPCASAKAPFPEGTGCAYYGISPQCNYDTGTTPNSGDLTLLNPVTIPSGVTRVSLHLWMAHDTELSCFAGGTYDASRVDISTNGGASWIFLAGRCDFKFSAPSYWNPRSMNLTAYQGQSVLLRFRFDTFDGQFNHYRGLFIDRITMQVEAGATFCTSTCPCSGPFNGFGQTHGRISGCRNSLGKDGELAGDGVASLTADTLTLRASEVPPTSIGQLVQATSFDQGAFSGEGRACITNVVRIGISVANNGILAFPTAGQPPLSSFTGLASAGGVRHYQVQYRDNATYCNSTNFNWTNGYSITWTP